MKLYMHTVSGIVDTLENHTVEFPKFYSDYLDACKLDDGNLNLSYEEWEKEELEVFMEVVWDGNNQEWVEA